MTDLHTHILPQLDDGAESLEMACRMLRLQKGSGVDRVALTSHFYPLREELEDYLKRRQQAYDLLMTAWDELSMPSLRLGAEVRYSTQLTELDLHLLALEGSDYLLLELSDTRLPSHLTEVVDRILMQGITPIRAHVERCTYFRQEPDRLLELIEIGALTQVSAKALADKKDKKFAKACLDNGLAQMIASDAHDLSHRAPCLRNCVAALDRETADSAEKFALAIWNNEPIPAFGARRLKKTLLGYR